MLNLLQMNRSGDVPEARPGLSKGQPLPMKTTSRQTPTKMMLKCGTPALAGRAKGLRLYSLAEEDGAERKIFPSGLKVSDVWRRNHCLRCQFISLSFVVSNSEQPIRWASATTT